MFRLAVYDRKGRHLEETLVAERRMANRLLQRLIDEHCDSGAMTSLEQVPDVTEQYILLPRGK